MESVIEQIAKNIQDTLANLAAGGGNINAIRPRRVDFMTAPEDLDCLIKQETLERLTDESLCQNWRQHFIMQIFVIDSDDETEPIDTRLNAVWSAVVKALLADPTRGGLAIDTQIMGADFFGDEGITGITCDFAVDYRTQWDDPETRI